MGLTLFPRRRKGGPSAPAPDSDFASTIAVPRPPDDAEEGVRLVGAGVRVRAEATPAGLLDVQPNFAPDAAPDTASDATPEGTTALRLPTAPALARVSGPAPLPPLSPLPPNLLPAPDPLAELPTLALIGRYALKRRIGSGGGGTVHEAWDPLLSRAVAIKTLQFPGDTNERTALEARFLNEARASAGLSHPSIVTVFDAGLSPQGVYLAMERLHGQDLRAKLAHGWRGHPLQAAQMVRRVADALSYAHERGIVHCDIKPANIFVVARDRPKVLDFGIARAMHSAHLPALGDMIIGSPHYLAPEQLTHGPLDARTDVYSLGVVLYELLAGRKAFNGDSSELITTAVLTNHPAPAHVVRSSVPQELSSITARAMAREPAARFACASEFSAELRRWAEEARPIWNTSARTTAATTPEPAAPSAAATQAASAAAAPVAAAGAMVPSQALRAAPAATAAATVAVPLGEAAPMRSLSRRAQRAARRRREAALILLAATSALILLGLGLAWRTPPALGTAAQGQPASNPAANRGLAAPGAPATTAPAVPSLAPPTR